MPVKPITPDTVVTLQKTLLPDWVMETWNKLIAKNWTGSYSLVYQDDAVTALQAAAPDEYARSEIIANKFVDIESIYEAEGWKVYYDKPGYNESYRASFKFTPKTNRSPTFIV